MHFNIFLFIAVKYDLNSYLCTTMIYIMISTDEIPKIIYNDTQYSKKLVSN